MSRRWFLLIMTALIYWSVTSAGEKNQITNLFEGDSLAVLNEEQIKILTGIVSVLLFAFTVSIDSFSIGVGFGVANVKMLLPCLIFSITSAIFTYLGVILGKRLSDKFGTITTLIGSIILIILGINYII